MSDVKEILVPMIRRVLVTGANGFLGSHVVAGLMEAGYTVYGYGVGSLTSAKGFTYWNCEDYSPGDLPWEHFDAVIHGAFARSGQGEQLIESLQFGEAIAKNAVKAKVSAFINISSQSVYGRLQNAPWTEEMVPDPGSPDGMYGLAKWMSEEILQRICEGTHTRVVSLRMASLSGLGLEARMTARFAKEAMSGREIMIKGGQWRISYLDVRDAADGLLALLRIPADTWPAVLNFGNEQTYSVLEIAETAVEIARARGIQCKVQVAEPDARVETGMDCERFYRLTGWRPKYDMKDMVSVFFEEADA